MSSVPTIEEHGQFNAAMHDFAQKSLREKAGVSREAIEIAHKRLTEHITTGDMDYARVFANPAHKSGNMKQGPLYALQAPAGAASRPAPQGGAVRSAM
ncbi:MAG TPA: hypothetical protein VMV87_06645 [Burkholderiales bacterium]|nr:hypothetical protein [Burkholderiales bacterium]